ncbi:hypothetical protein NPIL_147001 [Nephila pilipes]|uniref:Uncharacterized protein n=1 Tax=Nephila pilipes TaxID=299642 RepID=A0A8X6NV76_NEPPI|nr:hypothetical protein NPIL_147001 [Nephila pilipes]
MNSFILSHQQVLSDTVSSFSSEQSSLNLSHLGERSFVLILITQELRRRSYPSSEKTTASWGWELVVNHQGYEKSMLSSPGSTLPRLMPRD